jgi:RNA polymerase sigma factor (sigma-70 family)
MTSNNVNLQQRYIDGIINGNSRIINEVYDNYIPKISEYIRRKGGNIEDAQDVFQEAIMVIFKKAQITGFELKSSFYAFLFGICRNIWLQKIIPQTKKKKRIPAMNTVVLTNQDEEEIRRERFKIYEECLQLLSPSNRMVLELSAQELSNKEIAEKMGIESHGYLRIKKMRAKKELTILIQKHPMYEELCHF